MSVLVNGASVLLLDFVKYMLYRHYDEKLFKIFLYLYNYFVRKTAIDFILEKPSQLRNGWSWRAGQILVGSHF